MNKALSGIENVEGLIMDTEDNVNYAKRLPQYRISCNTFDSFPVSFPEILIVLNVDFP
jgi:hypothetical protein